MIPHTLPLLYLLFLCVIPGTLATEDDSSSSLKTWQIALIAGGGAVGLLLSALGVLMFRRRRLAAPSETVAMEEGTADAGTTIAVKTQSDNSVVTCPGGGKKCMGSRKEGVATIQPAKGTSTETKPSVPAKGTSKETKPSVPAKSVPPPPPASAVQSNNYPKPRRDSAPSKIGGNDRSDRKRAHKV